MADIDVHFDPISVVSGPVTVDVKGLDNTKIALETPQPVKFESKGELAVTQPVRTESKFEFSTPAPLKSETRSELDVRPLAIDQCLRISLAPLPPTCISFPSRQQIGFTLFGVEILGLRYCGESQVRVCEPPKEPHLAWGTVEAAPARPARPIAAPAEGTLRIRLGG